MLCRTQLFTLCAGLASAQHNLPNYFQGNFQVPSAPIPQPGSSVPATGAYQPQPLYQPQAQAYQAQPQAAAQYAQAQAYAAAAARAQQQQYQPAAAAPVAAQPMNYGWSVQHAPPPPAAPQPAHPAAPAAAVAPAAAYQQYGAAAVAAPQPAQYAQYAQARARSATLAQAYQPQPQQLAPPAPVAPAHQPAAVAAQQPPPAFMRPAQVHYASVGENLAGDYKVSETLIDCTRNMTTSDLVPSRSSVTAPVTAAVIARRVVCPTAPCKVSMASSMPTARRE